MKRDNNYELLRLVATVFVLTIHISTSYINTLTECSGTNYLIAVTLNCVSRVAVPCFLMISGAFNLDNIENRHYKKFYRKAVIRIGIPTVIFSFLYYGYGVVWRLLQEYSLISSITIPLKLILMGKPFYHMWYLYMLIPIFVFTPFIVKVKDELGTDKFSKFTFLFSVFATISEFTSTHKLEYDLGSAFCYMSYYMVGWVIRNAYKSNKKKWKAFLYIALFFTVNIPTIYIRYYEVMNQKNGGGSEYIVVGNFSPFIVIGSIALFAYFTNLKSKRTFLFSKNTFYVYLIHAGVWDVVYKLLPQNIPAILYIPLWVAVIYVVSYMGAKLYILIYKIIERKLNLNNKVLTLLGLE